MIKAPLGHVFGCIAFLWPTLAIFAHKGLAPLIGIFVLSAAGVIYHRRIGTISVGRFFLALVILFLAWCAISVAWSFEFMAGVKLFGKIVLYFVAGTALLGISRNLNTEDRSVFSTYLLAGVGVATLLIATVYLSTSPAFQGVSPAFSLFEFNHAQVILTVMAWPAALVLYRKGRNAMAVTLVLVVVGLSFFSESTASFVGGLLAIGVFLVVWRMPRIGHRALMAGTAIGVLTMPLLADHLPDPKSLQPYAANRYGKPLYITGLPPKGDMGSGEGYAFYPRVPSGLFPRIIIWRYVSSKIHERPIIGWGLNSSRFFNEYDRPGAGVKNEGWPITLESLPLHPHNAVLQWWLELGVVGAILGGIMVLFGFHKIAADFPAREERAIICSMGASQFAIALVAYGIWQAWWMCTLFAFAVFAAALSKRRDSGGPAA